MGIVQVRANRRDCGFRICEPRKLADGRRRQATNLYRIASQQFDQLGQGRPITGLAQLDRTGTELLFEGAVHYSLSFRVRVLRRPRLHRGIPLLRNTSPVASSNAVD